MGATLDAALLHDGQLLQAPLRILNKYTEIQNS
jgi:hypothetical protein